MSAGTVTTTTLTGNAMLGWSLIIPFNLLSLFGAGNLSGGGYYPSNDNGATFFPAGMNNSTQSYGTVTFYTPCAMTVSIYSTILQQNNQGIHQIKINGSSVSTKDGYSAAQNTASWVINSVALNAGSNTFQLLVNSKNASSSAYWLGYFQSNGFCIYRTS